MRITTYRVILYNLSIGNYLYPILEVADLKEIVKWGIVFERYIIIRGKYFRVGKDVRFTIARNFGKKFSRKISESEYHIPLATPS